MDDHDDQRRKQAGPLALKIKHKRSRNGCLTCRARRIKCDERRPRCGRCANAQRECVNPPSPGFTLPRQARNHTLAQVYGGELPIDVRLYLYFHDEFITPQHYFLKACESSEFFIHRTLLTFALQHDPLLYAILSLSSYFHALRSPNATVNTFLNYYNTSLALLRKLIGSEGLKNEATLLAILVLTTIEVGSTVHSIAGQRYADTCDRNFRNIVVI